MGEDVASFETYTPKRKHTFIFDCPDPNHPDAFERICERLFILSQLINQNIDENSNILIATTPEAIVGPCPKHEKEKIRNFIASRSRM